MSYDFLLDVSIILFFTKAFSIITKRMHLPGVVGALLSGIVLGPMGLGWLHETEALTIFAEVGVILLMFNAGLETNLESLKAGLKKTLVIASGDISIPFLTGIFIGLLLKMDLAQSIFLGVVFTATSMSITVETLQELKALNSKSGNAILSTAILDDLFGILLLTIVISLFGESSDNVSSGLLGVLINFSLFFTFAYITGFITNKIIVYLEVHMGHAHRVSIYSLAYCLLLAYVAELFGIADITGAYLAGLFLCSTESSEYVESKTSVLSYLLFSPIFFASIGLKAELPPLSLTFVLITALFVVGAIGSKVLGAGLGAKLAGYSSKDSLQIGVGMVPRGEVCLIMAERGLALSLIPNSLFSIIILVVILTSLISPILLALLYKNQKAT